MTFSDFLNLNRFVSTDTETAQGHQVPGNRLHSVAEEEETMSNGLEEPPPDPQGQGDQSDDDDEGISLNDSACRWVINLQCSWVLRLRPSAASPQE